MDEYIGLALYPCSTKPREVLGNPSPTAERFPETREISQGRSPREISRAEGMDFSIPPEVWWSTDILSSSICPEGVDQKILPCGQPRNDSVKINPSRLMMREWMILKRAPCGTFCSLCLPAHRQPFFSLKFKSSMTNIHLNDQKLELVKTLTQRCLKSV